MCDRLAIASDPAIQRLFLKFIKKRRQRRTIPPQQEPSGTLLRERGPPEHTSSSPAASASATALSDASGVPSRSPSCFPPDGPSELVTALQKHVDATLARLEGGYDYEVSELSEAIVRKRLEKDHLGTTEDAVVSDAKELAQLRRQYGAPNILSIRQLFPLEHIELLGGNSSYPSLPPRRRPPPITTSNDGIQQPNGRGNMGDPPAASTVGSIGMDIGMHQGSFSLVDDGSGYDVGMRPTVSLSGSSGSRHLRPLSGEDGILFGTDDDLERPPSVFDERGIRPFDPRRLATTTDGDREESRGAPVQTCHIPCRYFVAQQDAEETGDNWKQRAFQRMLALWRCRCSDHMRYVILSPFIVTVVILTIFRFVGTSISNMCTEDCNCSTGSTFAYIGTFGFVTRAMPLSAFFVYILHVSAYAFHKEMLENGRSEGGLTPTPAETTRGVRLMMSLHRTVTIYETRKRAAAADAQGVATNRGEGSGEDVTGVRRGVWWDIPNFRFCLQQRSFVVTLVVMCLCCLAGMSSSRWGATPALSVLYEFACVAVPAISMCFWLRVPQALWVVLLLIGTPYLAYFVQPRLPIPYPARYYAWPFVVYAAEKVIFYLMRAASLKSLPIGLRIASTTALTFTAQVVVMGSAIKLNPSDQGRALLGIAFQVFLYEMLYATMTLDRLWLYIRWQYVTRVRGRKLTEAEVRPLHATDLRCIATQTRWASMHCAWIAVGLTMIYDRWPRRVLGGFSCEGRSVAPLYAGSFFACVAAHVAAMVLTMVVRYRNDCLRMPLTVREFGFCLCLGFYLISTVPMALGGGDESPRFDS